jgi:GNAT superfamily N-acetyltransferase
MQKSEIRIASKDDLPELIELLTELFTQDIEFEPDYNKQKLGLETIIEHPNTGEILLLSHENKTIGMVSLLYSVSTALGGKVAILEDMIIVKNYRRQGYGTQLLGEAIRFSKERGCLRLTLLTDYNNKAAIQFYKRAGFAKSKMIPMRLIF